MIRDPIHTSFLYELEGQKILNKAVELFATVILGGPDELSISYTPSAPLVLRGLIVEVPCRGFAKVTRFKAESASFLLTEEDAANFSPLAMPLDLDYTLEAGERVTATVVYSGMIPEGMERGATWHLRPAFKFRAP
jgi:hypothetical protein